MRAISRRPQSTQRRPSIRSIRRAASRLSARESPHSEHVLLERMLEVGQRGGADGVQGARPRAPPRAPSRGPAGRRSPATRRASAWPCRPRRPPAGRSRRSGAAPAGSASLRLASVSAWLRKGTLRITTPAARTASALSCPENEPPGTAARRALARPRCARPASREPIAIGTPARPSLTARPKPSAPEAPMIATGSVGDGWHGGRV